MRWQDVALVLFGIIAIAGAVGYNDLFFSLFQLTGVNATYSSDQYCDTECVSYINVTTNYWRICFDSYSNTQYSNEILFKKQALSRTLHVNLDKVNNIVSTNPQVSVDWFVPSSGKDKWRTIQNGDCWERNKINKIKLVGYKESNQTVKWGVQLGSDLDIDPMWLEKDVGQKVIETKVSNLIYDAPRTWIISKSGAERYLNVNITDLNKTTSEVCLSFNNKNAYKAAMKLSNLRLDTVPIKDKNNINLMASIIDFNTKDENCFRISYSEKNIGNISFKIGYKSIEIHDTTTVTSTAYGHKDNLCVGIDGVLHAGWLGDASDIYYGNSTDEGDTWSIKELADGTFEQVGIVCHANGNVHVYALEAGDVVHMLSTDNGGDFSAKADLEADDIFTQLSCSGDRNSKLHCCIVEDDNDLWYVNSTNVGAAFEISSSATDHCGLDIDSNNNVYIAITDSSTDSLMYMARNNTWGTRTTISATPGAVPSTLYTGLSMDIDLNDTVHIAFIAGTDLDYCNGSISSWNCETVDTSVVINPSIGVTVNDTVYIFTQDRTDNAGSIVYAKKHRKSSWSIENHIVSSAGWASIASSRYNINNRINSTLNFIYTDQTADVQFDKLTLFIPAVPECVCPSINNNLALDSDCTFTSDCDLGTGRLSFTKNVIVTCGAKITCVNVFSNNTKSSILNLGGCQILKS